eukprot:7385436-Prymnesium_polylepis.2
MQVRASHTHARRVAEEAFMRSRADSVVEEAHANVEVFLSLSGGGDKAAFAHELRRLAVVGVHKELVRAPHPLALGAIDYCNDRAAREYVTATCHVGERSVLVREELHWLAHVVYMPVTCKQMAKELRNVQKSVRVDFGVPRCRGDRRGHQPKQRPGSGPKGLTERIAGSHWSSQLTKRRTT